jgi:hypothetical protein
MLRSSLKPYVPRSVRRIPHVVRAERERLACKIEVPDEPHFDAEGLDYFSKRIRTCEGYLEYGSGGSTVAVARREIPCTSVESDRRFLASVKRKVKETTGFSGVRYIPVNIGMTTEWGYPLFTDLTPSRVAKWKTYPWAPWPMSRLPDLVLIDGRFRIACALVCIKHLYANMDFEILFDDYGDRPHYRPIEEFARLDAMHGLLAVFKPRTISIRDLDEAINHFSTDCR